MSLNLKLLNQNYTQRKINFPRLKKLIFQDLIKYKISGHTEIGILIVRPKYIQKLNKKFRSLDKPTDVLSFPQKNLLSNNVIRNLGDIVICPAIAQKNAHELNHTLEEEIIFLTQHGLRHLLGIHHR